MTVSQLAGDQALFLRQRSQIPIATNRLTGLILTQCMTAPQRMDLVLNAGFSQMTQVRQNLG